tara:strand:- start:1018 stop:1935 length:918 start_codon:yes stop_codon:yes gene_type:complete
MNDLFQNSRLIESGASKKIVFKLKKNKYDFILIDFSKDKIEFYNFIKVYKILKNINISLPKIYEINFTNYLILMEDFGNKRFDDYHNQDNIKELLMTAVNSLITIQNSLSHTNIENLDKYNFNILITEIKEIVDYYFPYKSIESNLKNVFFDTWKDEFYKFNFYFDSFVHKDFNMNNLIFLPKKKNHLKCGIIDFQGAFLGFSGWDLFSLLEDSRIFFTDKYNKEILKYFYNNTYQKISYEEFINQYYFLNISRQTRLLGRWIKLDSQLKNKGYLNYIDTTIKRLQTSLLNLNNKQLSKLYSKIL